MSKQLKKSFNKLQAIVAVVSLLVMSGSLALVNVARSNAAGVGAVTVANWWPAAGVSVSGTQPFKGVVNGWNVKDYTMAWSVDGGAESSMSTNYSDSPHKEVDVNVTGWNWQSSNNYVITYIARSNAGAELGKTSFTINVPHETAAVVPAVTSSVTQTTAMTPVTAATPTIPVAKAMPSPVMVSAINFYVDADSPAQQAANALRTSQPTNAALLDKIATRATARWFGGWNSNLQTDVAGYVTAAGSAVPVLVAYNIPERDCGSFSAGGTSAASYVNWIKSLAAGIGSHDAWVVVEPDALAGMDCLSVTDQSIRLSLLAQAVTILKANPNTRVYLDAGNAHWQTPAVMAARLNAANLSAADGFSSNVSNFIATAENVTYGQAISAATNGKHFVIDTSRNGLGAPTDSAWCNPAGRALGSVPTTNTGNNLVDAYLWLKTPGESDGNCNGGPNAGTWWTDYALGLAQRANY